MNELQITPSCPHCSYGNTIPWTVESFEEHEVVQCEGCHRYFVLEVSFVLHVSTHALGPAFSPVTYTANNKPEGAD